MAIIHHNTWLRVLSINTKKYCDIQLTEHQMHILQRVFADPILHNKAWTNEAGSWVDNMFKWFNARIAAHNFIPTNEALVFIIPPERGHKPVVNKKKK